MRCSKYNVCLRNYSSLIACKLRWSQSKIFAPGKVVQKPSLLYSDIDSTDCINLYKMGLGLIKTSKLKPNFMGRLNVELYRMYLVQNRIHLTATSSSYKNEKKRKFSQIGIN